MNKEEISLKIKEIIIDKIGLDDEEITNEANLQYDLGFDELDTIEVVMDIEKEYSIGISDIELDSVNTFEQLVELTCKNIEV